MDKSVTPEQWIDACRPGRDDVRRPEFAELAEALEQDPQLRERYRRVRQLDDAVARAFADVTVPEGLANRLLQSVADKNEVASDETTVAATEPPAAKTWYATPRTWAVIGPVVAAIVALVFYLGPWRKAGPTTPTDRELIALTNSWLDSKEEIAWQPVDEQTLTAYPLDRNVYLEPTRLTRIKAKSDAQGVVYQNERFPTVHLLVLQSSHTKHAELPGAPPRRPVWNSQGRFIGVWKKGNRIYVLAVQGRDKDYQSWIKGMEQIG